MNNADVARNLSCLATMLEIDGANPFRVRAYREAARIVESLGEPVGSLAAKEGALEGLKGIGKDLAQKIRDLVTTGSTAMFEEMKARVPLSAVALTELQGLGPKRVKILLDVLGIQDHAQLEAAAKAGKLRELPGFGEKVEVNVLRALQTASQTSGRILLAGAWGVAHAIAAHLADVPGVQQVEIAGSFRRCKETIGDLDLLVTGGHPDRVAEAFIQHGDVVEILGRGETKSSVRLRNGLQVDMRHVPPESFGAALLYFTGSKAHNIELRKIAIEQGMSLNEYGLTRGERLEAGRTEEDVYRALGLKWIPPELREAQGEIEQARWYELPRLVDLTDLVADLHMHSDRSDGRDSMETMVRACRERGYRYCAITEHSKALAMTRGFDGARVRQSVAEVEAVRKAVPGIDVLHGLEVDILADGELDLDDESLALLDWVLISLHSRLDQPGPVVTERVLRALDHPAVSAMAHPTARMIGSRDPSALDMERVLERAAERGVWMEINASPDRMDLSDVNARLAKAKGVKLVIDTDAHSTGQLDNMRYGVFVARRAGLEKGDVMNALDFGEFREALAMRRAGGVSVAVSVGVGEAVVGAAMGEAAGMAQAVSGGEPRTILPEPPAPRRPRAARSAAAATPAKAGATKTKASGGKPKAGAAQAKDERAKAKRGTGKRVPRAKPAAGSRTRKARG